MIDQQALVTLIRLTTIIITGHIFIAVVFYNQVIPISETPTAFSGKYFLFRVKTPVFTLPLYAEKETSPVSGDKTMVRGEFLICEASKNLFVLRFYNYKNKEEVGGSLLAV